MAFRSFSKKRSDRLERSQTCPDKEREREREREIERDRERSRERERERERYERELHKVTVTHTHTHTHTHALRTTALHMSAEPQVWSASWIPAKFAKF